MGQHIIYVSRESEVVWEKFSDICKREGKGRGEKVIELISTYVASHSSGNNQTLLENAGLPLTLPLYQTCQHSRHEEDGRVAVVKGEFVCERDHHWKIPEACGRCDFYRGKAL